MRLNNVLKFALLNINIFFSFLGLAFFGFSFYLWFANWGKMTDEIAILDSWKVFDSGNLETGFFTGTGAILLLFGVAVILVSCIGCQGVDSQSAKYGLSKSLISNLIP